MCVDLVFRNRGKLAAAVMGESCVSYRKDEILAATVTALCADQFGDGFTGLSF